MKIDKKSILPCVLVVTCHVNCVTGCPEPVTGVLFIVIEVARLVNYSIFFVTDGAERVTSLLFVLTAHKNDQKTIVTASINSEMRDFHENRGFGYPITEILRCVTGKSGSATKKIV